MTFLAYRIDAENGIVYGKRGRPLGRLNEHGYVEVTINGRYRFAHRVIWESVNSIVPVGMQLNHINGKKNDNRIANLELVTPHENMIHAYKTALRTAVGAKNGRAILSESDVLEIRARYQNGEKVRVIADSLGVSLGAINGIVRRKNWKHI